MDLIQIIVVLAVIGFCSWLLLNFVPMPAPFKQVIIAIIALVLIIFLLNAVGIGHHTLRL